MNIVDRWKQLVDKMNKKGIPLPMVRDPKSGDGSLMVTLVVVSSMLCGISVVIMLATILNKLTGAFNLNESTTANIREAFSSSIQFFIASLGGYLGRKFQKDEKGALSLDEEKKS